MKTHLIFGLTKTICGKDLDAVSYTIEINKCTCKSCYKNMPTGYPKIN